MTRGSAAYRPQGAEAGDQDTSDVEFGVLEEFIGLYLRVAYERAYKDFSQRLGEDVMRPGYFTILTLIANNPGISQTAIGRAAGRDKSSVTKALRYMEDHGLITRTRLEDDRRTYVSSLTEKGEALQARMQRQALTHLDKLNRTLGPERRRDFIRTLRDLIARLPDEEN